MSLDDVSPEDQERMEAVTWWMRLQNDESEVFSAEFQEWIAIPVNEQKFRTFELAAQALDKFKTSPSIAEMHCSAEAWFENHSVSRRPSWKMVYAMAAAAVLVLAITGGTYYLWFASRPPSYRTALDERRAVALADGSRILLDSNTRVDVRYTKTGRALTLTQGHARFDVAHDTARPFSVTAGAETVIAVGTAFDVELRGAKVLVTLIQGRVRIEGIPEEGPRHTQADAPIKLAAGQQLVVSADHKAVIAPIDPTVTQAWEVGHLVFHRERLADAAEQINRYTDHPILVDSSAASFRISGVFNTGDTKSFIAATTELYPVEAVPDANGTITLRRSP